VKIRNISVTERAILRTFGTMMHLGPPDTVSKEKLTISKIQDGGGRHLEYLQNCNIAATD